MCKLPDTEFQTSTDFFRWYASNNYKLDLKHFFDLTESVEAGLLFSRLLAIVCSKQLRFLDTSSIDWSTECRLSEQQVKVSLTKLKERGLVTFDGPVATLCWKQLTKRINRLINLDYIPAWVSKKRKYSDIVTRIFEGWKEITGHPAAILGKTDKEKIICRLREGFSEERMIFAIRGCKLSPFHNGTANDNHVVYDRMDIIYKDAGRTEHFINIYENSREAQKNGEYAGTFGINSPVRVIPKTVAQERRIGNFERSLDYAKSLREKADRIAAERRGNMAGQRAIGSGEDCEIRSEHNRVDNPHTIGLRTSGTGRS